MAVNDQLFYCTSPHNLMNCIMQATFVFIQPNVLLHYVYNLMYCYIMPPTFAFADTNVLYVVPDTVVSADT